MTIIMWLPTQYTIQYISPTCFVSKWVIIMIIKIVKRCKQNKNFWRFTKKELFVFLTTHHQIEWRKSRARTHTSVWHVFFLHCFQLFWHTNIESKKCIKFKKISKNSTFYFPYTKNLDDFTLNMACEREREDVQCFEYQVNKEQHCQQSGSSSSTLTHPSW